MANIMLLYKWMIRLHLQCPVVVATPQGYSRVGKDADKSDQKGETPLLWGEATVFGVLQPRKKVHRGDWGTLYMGWRGAKLFSFSQYTRTTKHLSTRSLRDIGNRISWSLGLIQQACCVLVLLAYQWDSLLWNFGTVSCLRGSESWRGTIDHMFSMGDLPGLIPGISGSRIRKGLSAWYLGGSCIRRMIDLT